MNNKTEMTMDDLREVLLENEVTNFDPVAEAFKVRGAWFFIEKIVKCMRGLYQQHLTGIHLQKKGAPKEKRHISPGIVGIEGMPPVFAYATDLCGDSRSVHHLLFCATDTV